MINLEFFSKYLTKSDLLKLDKKLRYMSENDIDFALLKTRFKDPIISFLLALFGANLGFSRFYLNEFLRGFFYLCVSLLYIVLNYFAIYLTSLNNTEFNSPMVVAIFFVSQILKFLCFGIWFFEVIFIYKYTKNINFNNFMHNLK